MSRRWRAAGRAPRGWRDSKRSPLFVRRFTAQEKLEIALIENMQREDLSPIEEAHAYRRLMEMSDLSQEQVAQKWARTGRRLPTRSGS